MPYNEFPYDENTCTNKPRNANIQLYVTRDYNRLTNNNNPRAEVNIDAIKQNLAQGVPVVIGMMAGDILMQAMQGQEVWVPTRNDEQMKGFGGYKDLPKSGTIINSK